MAKAHCGFGDVAGEAHDSDLLVSFGPTILVDIGFDPGYIPSQTASAPLADLTAIQALVDMGATTSCIDDLLAVELALPVIDRMPIAGVGGQHLANMYLAQI